MHPTLLQWGQYVIYSHTFFYHVAAVAAAVVIGLELERLKTPLPGPPGWIGWLIPKEWHRSPYLEALMLSIVMYTIGIIGSHLLSGAVETLTHDCGKAHTAEEWKQLFYTKLNTKMWLGGFLATVPFWAWWAKRWKASTLAFCDIVSLGCAVALIPGKIACLMQGCCFGKPTDLPWGIVLDSMNSLAVYPKGTVLHPSQAYEIFYALAVFIYLWKTRKTKPYTGANFVRFMILMGLGRFFTEFVRSDTPRGLIVEWLSVSQMISLGIAGVGLMIHRRYARKN